MSDTRPALPIVVLLIDADQKSAAATVASVESCASAAAMSVDIQCSPDLPAALESMRDRPPALVLLEPTGLDSCPAAVRADLGTRTDALVVQLGRDLAHRAPHSESAPGLPPIELRNAGTLAPLLALAAERQRLIAASARAQRMEALGRLAGGVAHDFGNLLQIIQGHVEVLQDEVDAASGQQQDALAAVSDSADRAGQLVRQMLALGAEQAPATRSVRVDDLIERMHPLLIGLAGRARRVRIDPGAAGGRVKIDPSALEQSILNLVLNARHATQAEGSIEIRTRWEGSDAGADRILIEVIDDGCGMTEEVAERALEPFFSTRSGRDGSGLGLSSVNAVVRQCGGEVQLSSEPGVGTTVGLALPFSSVTELPVVDEDLPNAGKESSLGGAQAPMILFVDDEPLVVNVVRNILKRAGYRFLTASGPEEAEILFMEHEQDIDLLVTDVVMPNVNGRELYERLRTFRPELPVVFVSGFANDPELAKVLTDTVRRRLVEKPFRAERLLEVIDQVLKSPSETAEA